MRQFQRFQLCYLILGTILKNAKNLAKTHNILSCSIFPMANPERVPWSTYDKFSLFLFWLFFLGPDLMRAKTTFMIFFQFPQNPKIQKSQISKYPNAQIQKLQKFPKSKNPKIPNSQSQQISQAVGLTSVWPCCQMHKINQNIKCTKLHFLFLESSLRINHRSYFGLF